MTKRIFRLQFSENDHLKCECGHCAMMGLISPFSKVFEDYQRSISKLDYDLIDRILVPCFAHLTPHYDKVSELLSKKMILQIEGEVGPHILSDLSELDEKRENIIIINRQLVKNKSAIKLLGGFKGTFYLYAPRKKNYGDEYASLKQIHKFLVKLEKNGIEIKYYPGLSLWEDRAPVDMCFEPYSKKEIEVKRDIYLSIIIPVFEQKKYLLNTLRAISCQDYSLENVEVIVIDDGGSDHLREDIECFKGLPHLRYEYFPREIKRSMGDFRFRAGISRNLGYRLSQGETLFFLDADVLLPTSALKTITNEMRECDLLQIQRFDLSEEFTKSNRPLEEVTQKDILHQGRGYWYDFFYEAKEDWNLLKDKWKYVCTYGLIVKRASFISLGGFQNNYIGYGFEDTDLGLRMKNSGARFKLSNVVSYHQFHASERSEFRNGHFSRKKVLSRTAKTFFLNHLDPDIYRCLKDYM